LKASDGAKKKKKEKKTEEKNWLRMSGLETASRINLQLISESAPGTSCERGRYLKRGGGECKMAIDRWDSREKS
jgi:hypothetical protein